MTVSATKSTSSYAHASLASSSQSEPIRISSLSSGHSRGEGHYRVNIDDYSPSIGSAVPLYELVNEVRNFGVDAQVQSRIWLALHEAAIATSSLMAELGTRHSSFGLVDFFTHRSAHVPDPYIEKYVVPDHGRGRIRGRLIPSTRSIISDPLDD